MFEAKLYCQQLENLKAELQVNHRERRKVLLLHDNARPRTAKVTRQKLEELGCKVLPPSSILPRSGSLQLPCVPFAPQSSSHKTPRR